MKKYIGKEALTKEESDQLIDEMQDTIDCLRLVNKLDSMTIETLLHLIKIHDPDFYDELPDSLKIRID